MVWALGVAETRLTDTYTLANTTPNIVYELVLGGVLSGVLLRVFLEVRDLEGEEEAWKFITRLTNLALIILGTIAVVGVLAAPLIMRIYTSQAPLADRVLQQRWGSILLMLFIPQILFYGLNTVATAVLRAGRRFGVFMFAPVLTNLTATATFIVFASLIPRSERDLTSIPLHGILILGLGTTAGVALLGLVPFIYSRRVGRTRVKGSGVKDPRFRRLAKLSAYTAGYVASNMIGLSVTLILANKVQGGVAARDSAFVLFQLPHGLLAVSISIVIGTVLAERAVAEDMEGYRSALIRGLKGIAFVILPAVAGYLAIAPEIVRLLLEHGVVTAQSTELVTVVLQGYAIGLLFFSSWHLIYGAYQGLGDTRTPMIVNFIGVALQVGLSFTLFLLIEDPRLKVAGLAVAHALSYVAVSIVGLAVLRRKIGSLGVRAYLSTLARATAAALAVGISARLVMNLTPRLLNTQSLGGQVLQMLLALGMGLLIYVSVAKLLHLEELTWITRMMPGRRSQPAKPA